LATLTVQAINRRGKPVLCDVTCTPLLGKTRIQGVIMMVDEAAPA
jgi:two-component system, chemotaxis family, CheB/CheR fusion protein